jgi:hypothetical protein
MAIDIGPAPNFRIAPELRATWKLHVVAEKGTPLGNAVALDDI